MAPACPLSTGDFIAVIAFVKEVVKALRDIGGASDEYRELIYELFGLETALLEVKALDLEVEQRAQRVALRQAASQCQLTIDNFMVGLRKYQPQLGNPMVSRGWRDVLRKVQWQMCKKDDLVRFRAEVGFHAQSIQMLMLGIQLCVRSSQCNPLF